LIDDGGQILKEYKNELWRANNQKQVSKILVQHAKEGNGTNAASPQRKRRKYLCGKMVITVGKADARFQRNIKVEAKGILVLS